MRFLGSGMWSWIELYAIVGCADTTRVIGSISYLERVAMPETAVVTVSLVDVSRADAPAIVLGKQQIVTGGRQVPFTFEIPFDPAGIEPRHSYAIQSRIEDRGKLLFVSDRHFAVITRGAPTHIDMVLVPVRTPGTR